MSGPVLFPTENFTWYLEQLLAFPMIVFTQCLTEFSSKAVAASGAKVASTIDSFILSRQSIINPKLSGLEQMNECVFEI
jgi:hypothetical protein